jgi:hypothetical protein
VIKLTDIGMGVFTPGFNKNYFFLLLATAFSWSSCNLINPAEPEPGYFRINSIELTTNAATQGSSSNKIEDAWVYIDEELQGAYTMPESFPVLESGTHSVQVRAGIYFNGIKAQRYAYPFYSIYDTTINIVKGQEITLTPHCTYSTGLTFTLENFDNSGGIIFDTTSYSLAPIEITTDAAEVFEGTGSAEMHLDSAHGIVDITTTTMVLPNMGSERTIVEFNYRNSLPLQMGIVAMGTGYSPDPRMSIVVLNPTSEWNKIYVEISNSLKGANTSTFKIYFQSMLQDLNTPGWVYLDNFKVIHN